MTQQNKVRCMVFPGALNAQTFLRFLERLVRDSNRKIHLILDNPRVHQARPVRDWLAENQDRTEVFFLPSYSSELNPDERLNADLEQAMRAKPQARGKGKLKQAAIAQMRRIA